MDRILSFKGRWLDQSIGRTATRLGLAAILSSTVLPSHALQDSDRQAAANATVTGNTACTGLTKFYWEIGEKTGLKGSGTGGGTGTAPMASQQIPIYSAGKWVWGAYAYERLAGMLPAADLQYLSFTSGNADGPAANACALYTTVQSCRNSMAAQDNTKADKFYYGPAHFEQQAISSFGMGAFNKTQLAAEVHRLLGADFALTYDAPQMAGGAKSSATDYAKFLRKILNAQLRIGSALGSNAVCTYTDATNTTNGITRSNCPSAGYSPVDEAAGGLQEAWHYSIGHWVEDDPDPSIGDGAFSSPGAAGFYPWIDSSKTYYGILARNVVATTSAGNSVKCGRKIRKAWVTGSPQLQ